MPIGAVVNASAPDAYDAPFPEPRYQAGPLEFPALIPVREQMPGIAENRRAWEQVLSASP